MGSNRGIAIAVGILVLIVAIVVIALLAASFSGLHYYEYGFKVRRSSGVVDRKKVYGPGRYALGPDFTFKKFMADAHYLEFDNVTVFTSDKLEVVISVSMQYFLRKHQLIQLLNKFDVDYENTMENNALSSIKNAAIGFTARDYIHMREKVENALFLAARKRLGGECCEFGCKARKDGQPAMPVFGMCVKDCLAEALCNDTHYGLYADVRYFQLGQLEVPVSLQSKYLRALVLYEEDSREKLVQQAQLVRKDTYAKVQAIDNAAAEIRQASEAEAARIRAFAESSATAKIDEARSRGLQDLYKTLNFTKPAHKASFDYLRTMKGLDRLQLAIGFQSLQVKSETG